MLHKLLLAPFAEGPTFKLVTDLSFIQPSVKEVFERIITLGFYYRELDRFASNCRNLSWISSSKDSPLLRNSELLKAKKSKQSVYQRAIANGIVEVLSLYSSAVLHIEQKLLPDSVPILESSEFHKRSFETAVASLKAIAASHLWQLVVVCADLDGHLKALKDYFFLAKGDFFQAWIRCLESQLNPPKVELPKVKSCSDGDFSTQSDTSLEMSLDGWDGIALEYSTDWPLQLFFT
ncbi:gamma-tubulin complex component 4 [Olea europaea subsp. europaea]|uniref:Gamma-tubulin complex component n=1 Tax=Olea europaea subsp. europaea TaxID=158383 RepID=A0A8S0RY96_OLEEU|nr:gamma-tubulin complex component 4 [Olea europaea subsp. europaea]